MPRRQKKKNNARQKASSGETKESDAAAAAAAAADAGTNHEKIILRLLQKGPFRDFEDEDLTELVAASILEEITEQAPFKLNNDDAGTDGDGDGDVPPVTVVEDLAAMFEELIEGYVEDVDDLQEHWRVDVTDMAQDLVDDHPQLLLGAPKAGSCTIGAGDVCVALLEEDTTYHVALLVGQDGDDKWTVRFIDFRNLTRSVDKDLVKFTADLTEEARVEYGLTYVVEDGNASGGSKKGAEKCCMCSREIPITIHHLIPKSEHSRSDRTRAYLNGPENALECCRPCHSNIHRVADNATLAKEYWTLELLMSHPKIATFSTWVATQPITQWQRGAVSKLGRH